MELIADILLIAGALGAAFYCTVLSRRLRRFTDLEKGVGGAIAVLSVQVDDMTRALQTAQSAATGSTASLEGLTGRAESVSRKLELLVAAMHDLPETPGAQGARVDGGEKDGPGNGDGAGGAPEALAPVAAPSDTFRSRRN